MCEKLNIFVSSLKDFGCGKLQRKNFEFLWWFLGEIQNNNYSSDFCAKIQKQLSNE